MVYLAYGIAWLSTAFAVCLAMWITKSMLPLWFLFLPLFISIEGHKDKEL